MQYFHSCIRQYYGNTKGSIAHALLGQISASETGLGIELPAHERRQVFNRILLDLENDFYVEEVEAGVYDFAGGVLKLWWRKYHA